MIRPKAGAFVSKGDTVSPAWPPKGARPMAADTPEITAEITGRGDRSTVPDNADAVDATIYVDGEEIGEVTLLPDHAGRLSTWGSGLDHWADDGIRTWIDTHEDEHDRRTAVGEIEAAVRAAASE